MQTNLQNLRRVARPQRCAARLSLTGLTVGTPIMTSAGERPVEDLTPGDQLMTKDAGARPLLATSHQNISLVSQADRAPIYFERGSITPDFPSVQLYLDPMQLLVIRHDLFEMCFERREVLVTARDLVSFAGGRQITGQHEVSLIYLTLDAPHLVYCENVILALGCQDELPPRPIVTGNDLHLALSILGNAVGVERNQGFPLH